jgi:transposase-like protein
MARGRAYSLDFRIAMMKQHAQGRSFSTLSRETDVPRDVLRRWWCIAAGARLPCVRDRVGRAARPPK